MGWTKNKPDPAVPLRILIVRVGAMGDVLHGMPAVAALRAAFPLAEIGWAIEPRWSPLLRSCGTPETGTPAMPLVDRIHEVPTRQWSKAPFSWSTLRSIRSLRAELRAERYDLAIDLQGSIRSAIIARMSGARRVVGGAAPRERLARWLYRLRVPATRVHVVEQAAEIVSAAVATQLEPAGVGLPVSSAAEEWAASLLAALPPGPVVLLAPTAGWGAKEWSPFRYGSLAQQLADRGMNVLVNASPAGADGVASLVGLCSAHRARIVPGTLPQLIALIRHCNLVVAGDSGPLHLAAALGIPTVALFGPTDPIRTGPWANRSRVLRNSASLTSHRRQAATERGLALMEVSEVLQAALELLGSANKP